MRQIYFHISDYYYGTRHCSRLQRSIHLDCIFLCYDKESPLPPDIDQLCRLLTLTTDEERQALEVVLEDFWSLEADGYHNKRCDEEIVKYHEYREKKSKAGKASGVARKRKLAAVEQVLNTRGTREQQSENRKPKAESHNTNTLDDTGDTVEPSLIGMPTNRFETIGEEFAVTESMVTEWQKAYPSLDVMAELPQIRSWLLDNPRKRKTVSGMRRCIGSWLARNHDEGRPNRSSARANQLGHRSTRDRSFHEDLTDTSWA